MSKEDKNDEGVVNHLVKASSIDKPVSVAEYFRFLDVSMDDYSDLKISEEAAKRIKTHLISLRTGTHAVVPLICAGAIKCPIGKRCPLAEWKSDGTLDQKASTFPILKPCPFERHILSYRMQDYITEYDVDPNSPSSLAMVNKLAELDIYEMRCDVQLSSGTASNLLQEEVTTVNPRNNKVYSAFRIHPLWEIKERIQKQRDSLLTALMGTPRERYKIAKDLGNMGEKSDLVKDMSSLQNTLRALASGNINAIDADFSESDSEEE